MEQHYAQTSSILPAVDASGEMQPSSENNVRVAQAPTDLMAPGHLYNARTGTGIEWVRRDPERGIPGAVRLWSRGWNGQPTLLGEAKHHTSSPWDYWYKLEFARSFPQVTHWWFGDAWTGSVRIWGPDAVGRDPESGYPMLSGWMCFGGVAEPDLGSGDMENMDYAPVLPWTVLLTDPVRVHTPMPPRFTNPANLPLQLLLADRLLGVLNAYIDAYERAHEGDEGIQHEEGGSLRGAGTDVAMTSLVRSGDLHRAFPTRFGPWRLDRLADMTPREALCRQQGVEPR